VTTPANSALFRKLPSVDELLRSSELSALIARETHAPVTHAARAVLDRLRSEIASGHLDESQLDLALTGLPDAIERELRRALAYSLHPLINATGVILHTNLGRAPLTQSAVDHIREAATTYSNLEFDITTGDRGKRDVHVDRLFRKLLEGSAGLQPGEASVSLASPQTPSRLDPAGPSTIVVNNNAAAVLIALNTLAETGEVIVSRGELVEIGGSFRIPDVMSKSGAILREVGTTNRTRLADYERAITDRTRLLLRVHRSNFKIVGFTEQPSLEDLVALGHRHNIPVMEDLGSGALFDLHSIGIHGEPGVTDSLRAGVDVITYSGDKLLGGPQAGIISGRPDLVTKIRSNPLFRALRVDKLTYAALEATLMAYAKQDYDSIPALRMMRLPVEEIEKRAQAIFERSCAENERRIKDGALPQAHSLSSDTSQSVIGGGAAPGATLPTVVLALKLESITADEVLHRLRQLDPPIIARVEDDRVLLDLRTVFPEQDEAIVRALLAVTA
jgi:L-seryl-tRNA(Ser) seleniumtransferase